MSNPAPQHLSPGQRAWNRFKKNRLAVFSAWYLVLLLAVILAWPVLLAVAGGNFAKLHNPDQLSDAQFLPPSVQHWFGTDVHGRDLLSRTLYGAQISLLVGFFGAAVSLIIGVLWGAVAGYVGGRVDSVLMRLVDVLYSLPSIIFVIVLIMTVGERIRQLPMIENSPGASSGLRVVLVFTGLGAISWLTMARIVRGQVLSLRSRAFVEASRTLGAGTPRILFRHIIPNSIYPVLVVASLSTGSVVITAAALSFLGLGAPVGYADWGQLISLSRNWIMGSSGNPFEYWHTVFIPGIAIFLFVLGWNLLGDAVRDILDPRQK